MTMQESRSPFIEQIPLEQMERGLARPVATLRLEPGEIANRVGLKFEIAHDDLDELEAAVFRAASGRQFALVRHRHQPKAGTDILIKENSRNLSAALRDALKVLQFEPRELRWIHPKIDVTKLSRFFSAGKAAVIQEATQNVASSSVLIHNILGSRKERQMANENKLYIERRDDGTYAVRRGNSQRASAVTDTQREAIERAKELNPGHRPDVERVRNTDKGGRDKWRKA